MKETKFDYARPYEPQIYFYVLRQVLSILLPLDIVLADVRNVLLKSLFN